MHNKKMITVDANNLWIVLEDLIGLAWTAYHQTPQQWREEARAKIIAGEALAEVAYRASGNRPDTDREFEYERGPDRY